MDTTLLPPMNGDVARCNGNPKANPNAPSANACSSNHCGAERTNGSCGKSIPRSLANSVATISSLPIARHGPN